MAKDIEQLLRLAADYHRFCFDGFGEAESTREQDELGIDELDTVFAAGTNEHLLNARDAGRKPGDGGR